MNLSESVKRKQDELLEIYCLMEENRYSSTKAAVIRYQALVGRSNFVTAHTELRAKYLIFIGKA